MQIGTVDALIAQLCIRHDVTLLGTAQDFVHAAKHCKLKVWLRPQSHVDAPSGSPHLEG